MHMKLNFSTLFSKYKMCKISDFNDFCIHSFIPSKNTCFEKISSMLVTYVIHQVVSHGLPALEKQKVSVYCML
jgi:hypothetical protein